MQVQKPNMRIKSVIIQIRYRSSGYERGESTGILIRNCVTEFDKTKIDPIWNIESQCGRGSIVELPPGAVTEIGVALAARFLSSVSSQSGRGI